VGGGGLEVDLHARLLADEHVGAGTDRMLLEAVVSDPREIVLWHDDAGGAGGRAVERHEIGPWCLEMKAYYQGIDDLDLSDVLLQDLRRRTPVAVEAELHVFRRYGIAVVKLQSRTQLELVRLAVRTLLPRFREAWAHLLSGIRADERIVDRVEHAERRDLRRRGGRIEPARRDGHVPRHDGSSPRYRRGSCGRGRGEGGDRDEQQTSECATQTQDLERRHEHPPRGNGRGSGALRRGRVEASSRQPRAQPRGKLSEKLSASSRCSFQMAMFNGSRIGDRVRLYSRPAMT